MGSAISRWKGSVIFITTYLSMQMFPLWRCLLKWEISIGLIVSAVVEEVTNDEGIFIVSPVMDLMGMGF
jgi:hypothetical protein